MPRKTAKQVIKQLRKAMTSEDCFELDAMAIVREFMKKSRSINETSSVLEAYTQLYDKRVDNLHQSTASLAKNLEKACDKMDDEPSPSTSTAGVVSDPEVDAAVVSGPEVSAAIVSGPEVSAAIVSGPEVSAAVVSGPDATLSHSTDPSVPNVTSEDASSSDSLDLSAMRPAEGREDLLQITDFSLPAEWVRGVLLERALQMAIDRGQVSSPHYLDDASAIPGSYEHGPPLAWARRVVARAELNQDPDLSRLRQALLRTLPYRWDKLIWHEQLREYSPSAVLLMSLMLANAGSVELVRRHGSGLVLRLRNLGPGAGANRRGNAAAPSTSRRD